MARLLVAAALLAAVTMAETFHVFQSGSNWSVSTTIPAGSTIIANLTYTRSMMTTGWDVLNVSTNAAASDENQAYAAGFGEGWATYEAILNGYNSYASPHSSTTEAYLTSNWKYMQAQIAANPNDSFWHQVSLSVQQFQGMLDGINRMNEANGNTAWTMLTLQEIVAQGDFIDLDTAWPPPSSPIQDWRTMTPWEFEGFFHKRTHCSALIKVTPAYDDIFFGHATWSSYSTMLRIYKHYTLNFANVPSKQVSFSSYPGALSSTDDFYVTDTGLSIIETTNNVFNNTLYNALTANSLLYWVRVMVATRLATNGSTWMQYFGRENSGTYNNQWMVVDLNKFVPGADLNPGTLWVGEQLPGYWQSADVTRVLALGYWPSYNVPYFSDIFTLSGYPSAIQQQGPDMLDYELCARAKIFRRDQGAITNLNAFINIMQYNKWQTDPFSNGRATHQIAARGDLAPPIGCFGAIDAKVGSYKLFQRNRQVLAYGGPTPQQGPFSWKSLSSIPLNNTNCRHLGQPETFDFMWQQFIPVPPAN